MGQFISLVSCVSPPLLHSRQMDIYNPEEQVNMKLILVSNPTQIRFIGV